MQDLHCVKSVRIRCYSGPLLRSISLYTVRMRENADQSNSEYGHFLRSANVPRTCSQELKKSRNNEITYPLHFDPKRQGFSKVVFLYFKKSNLISITLYNC